LNRISRGFVWPAVPGPAETDETGTVEMANRGELNEGDALASTAILDNLPELISVFGALLQSPLKEFAHLVCGKLVVSCQFQTTDSSRECLGVG